MGPDALSPLQLGALITAIIGADKSKFTETSLAKNLKKDHRLRLWRLKIDTRKYKGFCESRGLGMPRSVRETLS